MPPSLDTAQANFPRTRIFLLAAIVAGFGLTLFVFYPGVMTYDARYVYEDIAKHSLGDWQSPVMTVLWSLIDPLAPGPASMFLFIVALYWLAFGLLAFAIARRCAWLAFALVLLALSPPAFVFIGTIWRDVLFACAWLLAATLVFAFAESEKKLRVPAQALAFALLALGVLLRPNAIIAAPLLGIYISWPTQFSWKRVAIVFVPAAIACYALIQVVYYGALGATRQNPLHSVLVFDLGGISHFAQENQYPVSWSAPENALLLDGCYKPTEWDLYWRHEPCLFVMKKLEGEKIFGTPAMPDAWKRAVAKHPAAYLQHRASLMWNFLTGANLTMWTDDVYVPEKKAFADRPAFNALRAIHDTLKPTPLFRAGTWLIICIAVCALGWRRRETPAGAFAIGVCGSAALYVLTFAAVGVASDFRYAYFAVLAAIAGAAVIMTPRRLP